MKLRILLLIGVVALVTLSFTFSGNSSLNQNNDKTSTAATGSEHVIGFIADEVEK